MENPTKSYQSVLIQKLIFKIWSSCLFVCCRCRHYWAFKVEPFSYMVKVGVASDSKLLEWFHSPRDTSSPR